MHVSVKKSKERGEGKNQTIYLNWCRGRCGQRLVQEDIAIACRMVNAMRRGDC
jgi:hypothetical protein